MDYRYDFLDDGVRPWMKDAGLNGRCTKKTNTT